MVRVTIELVKSEESISRITFAGLCSVLRAGLAVLETKGLMDDDEVVETGEIQSYIRILRWFSGRWTVGNEYLVRAEEVLGLL